MDVETKWSNTRATGAAGRLPGAKGRTSSPPETKRASYVAEGYEVVDGGNVCWSADFKPGRLARRAPCNSSAGLFLKNNGKLNLSYRDSKIKQNSQTGR